MSGRRLPSASRSLVRSAKLVELEKFAGKRKITSEYSTVFLQVVFTYTLGIHPQPNAAISDKLSGMNCFVYCCKLIGFSLGFELKNLNSKKSFFTSYLILYYLVEVFG